MNKTIIAVTAGIALVGAVGLAIWLNGDDPEKVAAPIVGSSNTAVPVEPSATPTTPATPSEQFGPDVEGTDDTGPAVEDPTAFTSVAEDAATAYLTWDSAESAESRSARLAPFFPAGAPELETMPTVSGSDIASYEGFTSTSTVNEVKYSGFDGSTADTFTFGVLVEVNTTIETAGTPEDHIDLVQINAVMDRSDPTILISLTEK